MKTLAKTAFLFIFISTACHRTGTKALNKGQYYEAVVQATDRLKKEGDNEKSTAVLKNAYAKAIDELLDDAKAAENKSNNFRWERVLDIYTKINKMNDDIQDCRACRKLVNVEDYYAKTAEIRDFAAFERYNFASALLNRNTKDDARKAFENFEILFRYAPGYKDVKEMKETAFNAGTYHIVLEQPKLNARMFQYSNEYFQNKVQEFLNTNRRMSKFVQFYTPNEAKRIDLNPDHIIRLEFIEFNVGESQLDTEKLNLTSKDSVKVGDVKIGDKTVDVKNKVTAIMTKYDKKVRSSGVLGLEIYDYRSQRVLLSERMPGEFVWRHQWATYNGDERALTAEQKTMTNIREATPPSAQDLFIEFTKPIYDQTTNRIRRFYDKY